jgi:RNA polymerase sigma-70 factor, ECF subfamily
MASRLDDDVDLLAPGWDYRLVTTKSEAGVSSGVSPKLSDVEHLVIAARKGDRSAFGRLYDLHARAVHGVLLARVPLGFVDDLVQDVFLMALRRLTSLRQPASFGAWIAAIARNAANDFHRRPRPEEQQAGDSADAECTPAGATDDPEGLLILDAIRKLPEAYRETLILRLVEDLTGPEIAARTGMTHGSVRVNLHRGMHLLREKLNSNPGNPPGQESL